MSNPRDTERAPAPLSPLCASLRSKKYFFLGRPPLDGADLLDGSQHCWCQRTQQAVGPDHFPVDPGDCRAARPCYTPIG